MYNGVCWSSRECAFRGFNCGDAPRGDACESKCGCFSMSLRCRPFTALLVCIGIALPVAALAGAEPDNPFSGLSCSCDERFRVGIMLMLSEYSRGSGPASVAAFDRRRCPRWPPTVPERPTARCSAPVCRGVQGNLGRRQCTAPNRWSGSADTVVPVAATAHSEDAARASGWVCGPDAPRTPQIISRVGTDPACSWQALTSSAHDAAPPLFRR